MTERLVTLTELREQLDALLAAVEGGETVVLVDDRPDAVHRQRVVLLAAERYRRLVPEEAPSSGAPVEAKVGGVAGGLVAGAGTTISSITGKPEMARGARRLGRRLGRALAVGLDALGEDKRESK
jgi:antitoxin (DNA-binding transcriptional repressor) of toxin-antitoxin stability system